MAAFDALPAFGDRFVYRTIRVDFGQFYFNAVLPQLGPHVVLQGAGEFTTFLNPDPPARWG